MVDASPKKGDEIIICRQSDDIYLKSYWKTVRANTSGWLENKGLEVQCASGGY